MKFIFHHEIDRRLIGNRVRAVIVYKFCVGNLFRSRGRIGITEDAKVGFNLLVYMFYFSIRLIMINSREEEIVV